jgi:hypothetical protein
VPLINLKHKLLVLDSVVTLSPQGIALELAVYHPATRFQSRNGLESAGSRASFRLVVSPVGISDMGA